jgi:hypothetical protein
MVVVVSVEHHWYDASWAIDRAVVKSGGREKKGKKGGIKSKCCIEVSSSRVEPDRGERFCFYERRTFRAILAGVTGMKCVPTTLMRGALTPGMMAVVVGAAGGGAENPGAMVNVIPVSCAALLEVSVVIDSVGVDSVLVADSVAVVIDSVTDSVGRSSSVDEVSVSVGYDSDSDSLSTGSSVQVGVASAEEEVEVAASVPVTSVTVPVSVGVGSVLVVSVGADSVLVVSVGSGSSGLRVLVTNTPD